MGLRLILPLVTAAGPSRILTGVPLFQKRKERFDHLAALTRNLSACDQSVKPATSMFLLKKNERLTS